MRVPEPVEQSIASLTSDQKVWGSIPTRAKAKRQLSLSTLTDKIALVVQNCKVPTPHIPGMVYPRLPNLQWWVQVRTLCSSPVLVFTSSNLVDRMLVFISTLYLYLHSILVSFLVFGRKRRACEACPSPIENVQTTCPSPIENVQTTFLLFFFPFLQRSRLSSMWWTEIAHPPPTSLPIPLQLLYICIPPLVSISTLYSSLFFPSFHFINLMSFHQSDIRQHKKNNNNKHFSLCWVVYFIIFNKNITTTYSKNYLK
jgi:hypothetical protein